VGSLARGHQKFPCPHAVLLVVGNGCRGHGGQHHLVGTVEAYIRAGVRSITVLGTVVCRHRFLCPYSPGYGGGQQWPATPKPVAAQRLEFCSDRPGATGYMALSAGLGSSVNGASLRIFPCGANRFRSAGWMGRSPPGHLHTSWPHARRYCRYGATHFSGYRPVSGGRHPGAAVGDADREISNPANCGDHIVLRTGTGLDGPNIDRQSDDVCGKRCTTRRHVPDSTCGFLANTTKPDNRPRILSTLSATARLLRKIGSMAR